jgi:2-octaprenyl-3-methyl-6-methoxy-1,4-benzoquinol hydroxylase
MEQFDCVVIGGGMVGAASALSLAELGLKVALIEKESEGSYSEHELTKQPFDLRVSAISIASEHLLNQLGAWQQIKAWRVCPYQRLAVWEKENSYTEFHSADIKQNHLGHIVENHLIQFALWQQIKTKPSLHIFCPEELVALEQNENYAQVTLTHQILQAKLVVGADGAQSKVRQMAGIGLTGWDYEQSAMLINVETELPQQDITWQQYLPTGPVAFLPLVNNEQIKPKQLTGYASLVWYHQRDEIKRLSLLSDNQLEQEVLRHFPKRLGNIKVLRKGAFPLTRRHANSYQNKRVLLLGDAAHTINPMAGQGVNLGFKDVKALQEVIATAIANGESWHETHIFTRYEKMRRTDNLLMMTTMDALYTTFSHPSSIVKAARNLTLLAINKAPFINNTVKNKVLAYACGVTV